MFDCCSKVKVLVETRNRDHTRSMFSDLCQRYNKIRLVDGKFITSENQDINYLFAQPLTPSKEQYVLDIHPNLLEGNNI